MKWEGALCKGKTQMFFPGQVGGSLGPAKALCRQCPLQVPCLEYAVTQLSTFEDQDGVWGGTTARQRRALRRQYRQTQR